MAPAARKDMARVGLGAMLGLGVAMLLVLAAQRLGLAAGMNLFAPLGASAVLLFAVHTSPLAQPWSCVVGNVVSGLWACLVVQCLPLEWVPAVAVGGAIMVMQWSRSLHPPGGAVALLWALDAQHGMAHGWSYALWPIGVLTLFLVLAAMLYHRLWGKTYPLQPQAAARPATAQHLPAMDLSTADLQALLARFDQGNNLTAQELGQLVLAAEEQAIARRFGSVSCGQVMTTHPWTCTPDATLDHLAAQFQQHPIKSLPVVDDKGRLLGVVARSTLLDWVWHKRDSVQERRQRRVWRLWGKKPAHPTTCAADLMESAPMRVQDSTPVAALLEALAQHAVPFVAVLHGEKLVGLITRTDIMRLLLH
ncbi:HPP family protein [Comamonas sp.]